MEDESAPKRGQTACVIGGTGLVGSALVRALATDPRFERIVLLVRRPPNLADLEPPGSVGDRRPPRDRISVRLVDFSDRLSWEDALEGDVLFSVLGTTIRKAGSPDAQYAIDYGIQYAVAKSALARGFEGLVLVSSTGADPESRIFYFRMKGELDRDVSALSFPWVRILRPGPLDGERAERRVGEAVGVVLARGFAAMGIARDHRPIHADTVARAMIRVTDDRTPGVQILGPGALFSLGGAPHADQRDRSPT
jgi:uncharacterized protein YbjT (DUF2867 family)